MIIRYFSEKRARKARNLAKAKALVEQHGEHAEIVVREKVAASTWQIRDHAHWQRIERHVKSLLQR